MGDVINELDEDRFTEGGDFSGDKESLATEIALDFKLFFGERSCLDVLFFFKAASAASFSRCSVLYLANSATCSFTFSKTE